MQNVASQNFPRLVGDIGGTNIRFAVIAAAGAAPTQIATIHQRASSRCRYVERSTSSRRASSATGALY